MKGIEGSTLGRYELRRRIARGGMSEVYLGYDRRVRRRVAVKVLYGSDEPFVRRFEREALAVGTLSHDHILPLYDFGQQRPWYYLVMPYVEGGTLRDYLLQKEQLTLEEAEKFLEEIASALQYAHDHGVVHRDVKPSNILLRPDGYAYLVDFGLAKARREADSLSHFGAMVGTPEYMAPEQSNGINDYRSDIYSLGILLYQMLTGRVPFTADSPVGVTLKHLQTQPPPPGQFNSAIGPAIEAVILKALAKDPEERYQQASALSAAYKQALQQTPLQIPADRQATAISASQEQQSASEATTETTPGIGAQVTSSAEQGFVPTITTTMPLQFALGNGMASISWGKSRRRLSVSQWLLILLSLLLLASSITFGWLWHTHMSPQNPAVRSISSPSVQPWPTASAKAQIEATLAAQARAQATAGITSAIGAGHPLYSNDFTEPGGGWIDDGDQCYFASQGYHVYTDLTHGMAWCYSNQQRFSDAIITAQGQLLRGDIYGLVFRLSPASKAFYALELNAQGEYRLVRAQGDNPLNWLTLIDWTPSSAIPKGYGHTNTFLVITTGSHFRIYINKQLLVSTISDAAYATGMIGFLVGGDTSGGTEATFSNVWVSQK